MNYLRSPIVCICLFALVLCACAPSRTELDEAATAAVATYQESLATLPTATLQPTYTPYPTQTAAPSATPQPTHTPAPTLVPVNADVNNLFCNFGFCLRYPEEALLVPQYALSFLTEVAADLNEIDGGGYLWGYGEGRLLLRWDATTEKPQDFVTDFLDDPDYTDVGPVTNRAMNNIEVAYASFETEGSMPYGIVSAWHCGGRLFKVIIHSRAEDESLPQLESSVNDFICTD